MRGKDTKDTKDWKDTEEKFFPILRVFPVF